MVMPKAFVSQHGHDSEQRAFLDLLSHALH